MVTLSVGNRHPSDIRSDRRKYVSVLLELTKKLKPFFENAKNLNEEEKKELDALYGVYFKDETPQDLQTPVIREGKMIKDWEKESKELRKKYEDLRMALSKEQVRLSFDRNALHEFFHRVWNTSLSLERETRQMDPETNQMRMINNLGENRMADEVDDILCNLFNIIQDEPKNSTQAIPDGK